MGATYVTVRLRSLSGRKRKPFEAQFLVDTGAIDCLAPADKLRAAGITPKGTRVYELADGTSVEYEYGFARIELFGDETITQVRFAPAGTAPILGSTALLSIGVIVDSKTGALNRLPALPLKRATQASPLHHSCRNHRDVVRSRRHADELS